MNEEFKNGEFRPIKRVERDGDIFTLTFKGECQIRIDSVDAAALVCEVVRQMR